MITEATKARFAKEVAKYPPEQKQSAVMACLSIVQQELGHVSPESEKVVAEYLGNREAYAGTTVRVAGRVRADSIHMNSDTRELRFTLDDMQGNGSVEVHYAGLVPDMFAEGRDVIIEGRFVDGTLQAQQVMTSCPSKYEPKPGESDAAGAQASY